jgi:hypothetical protein
LDFEFEHKIAADTNHVAQALVNEDYQRSLADVTSLADRELLEQKVSADGRVKRRVRCVLDIQLNPTVRSFIGNGDPAWIEEATSSPDLRTWDWNVIPEIGGNLLAAKGLIELDGSSEATIRRVTGSVKVNVPLYGGKVEKVIISGLERAYAEEAERLADWVKRENG